MLPTTVLLRVLLASVLAAVAPLALTTSADAAPSAGAVYGDWAVSSGSGTMQIPLGGFPAAAVLSNGSPATVQSGKSAFLGAGTPVGARYGSSQNRPYINVGAKGGASSTTTLSFASPTPAGTWAFVLGDVDADRVQVQATGADGNLLTTAQLGWQGSFNYCVNSPKPSSCVGPGPFNDLPTWDSGTDTLVGSGIDTNGASGWFQPTVPVRSITLTFSVQIGIPIFQLWTASLATSVEGTVSSDCGTPVGTTVALRRASGKGAAVTGTDGKPLTATVGADGGYSFTDLAPGAYRAVLDAPDGYSPSTVRAGANTSSGRDVTDADLKLSCDPAPAPPTPPVVAPSGGDVVIPVPPGPGPSGNADPKIVDPPAHGTVVVGPGNKLVYTPHPTFTGRDRITYTSIDSKGRLLLRTVMIDVRATLAATGTDLPPLPLLALAGALAATGLTFRRLAGRRGAS